MLLPLSPPPRYPQRHSPCNFFFAFFLFSFLFCLMIRTLLHLPSKKLIRFCIVQWRPCLGSIVHPTCVPLEPGAKKYTVLPTRLYSFNRVQTSRSFAVASYQKCFVHLPIFLSPLKPFSLDLLGVLMHRMRSENYASNKKNMSR